MKPCAIIRELTRFGSPTKAVSSTWFFKTGKGQYGYGDEFVGVTVSEQRKVAKKFADLGLVEIDKLLKSKIHEYRLTALFILVAQFREAIGRNDQDQYTKIIKFYLAHIKCINNWDLVDSSASYILGTYLQSGSNRNGDRNILYKLARSENLWERRIAIVTTLAFIRARKFEDTLKISKMLMSDKHDLIHKAVGWMLREVGKMSKETLMTFLNENASRMPRTTLRYSIERFGKADRKKYLSIKSIKS
jgi:3-methyladenine DNA glycosylase AlkD